MRGLKLLLVILISFVFVSWGFGFYLNLTPSQRKDLAKDWLEAAKAYEKSGKAKKAIISYKHVYNLYPFGNEAKEAQRVLKEKYGVSVTQFDEALFENYNVDLAKKYEKEKYKYSVNAYLMAYDVSGKPDYLYKAALVYWENGQKDKAKDLALKAIQAGFDKSKVKEELLK